MWLRTIVVGLLCCLTSSLLMAQTPKNEPADLPKGSPNQELRPIDLWSSRLTQEAVDEFQTDSRENYVVQKDVDWESGALTINPGSSITIPLNSGSEGAIHLTLNPDTKADLGVAIIPEGAPPCVVEIRSRTADFPTTTSIRLVESQTQNGNIVQKLVREVQFDAPATIESATVHYRYGVVSVSINDSVRMVSFVARGAAPVRRIFVGTQSQPLTLNAMSLRRTKPNLPLTAAEKQELAVLQVEYESMLKLYQQGEKQEALDTAKRILPKLKPLLKKTAPGSLPVLNDLAFLHFQVGKMEEAKSLYEEVLALYAELPGQFYPEAIGPLNQVSFLHEKIGDLDAAEDALTRMARHYRFTAGPESPEYLATLTDIGSIRRQRNQFDSALEILEQAHGALVRSDQQNSKVFGDVLQNITKTYTDQQDYDAAMQWGRKAVKWNFEKYDRSSLPYVNSLINLATAEQNRDSEGLQAAVVNLQQAQALLKTLQKPLPKTEAIILNNLGSCYRDQYRLREAAAALEQAATIFQQLPSPPVRKLGMCLTSLAETTVRMGDSKRAEKILKQAYQLFVNAGDLNSFAYARLIQARGNLAMELGDYDKALVCASKVVSIMEKIRDRGHPDYCMSLQNLGAVHLSIGQYRDALTMFEAAIGADPPNVTHQNRGAALSLQNVAAIYQRQGRVSKAKQCLEQALKLNQSLYGKSHPIVADCQNALGALFHDQGDLEIAEQWYRQALKIHLQPGMSDSTTKALVLENLGRISLERGGRDSALEQLESALQIYTDLLGERHTARAAVLHDLARLAEVEGQRETATRYLDEAFRLAVSKLRLAAPMQSVRQQIWHQNELRIHLFAFITHAIRTSSQDTATVEKLWEWKQAVTRRQAAYRKLSTEPEAAALLQALDELAGNASLLLQNVPQSPTDDADADAWERFAAERLSHKEQLREINRKQEQIEQQLVAAAKKRGLDLGAPELREIRQALPEKSALIEFVKYVHMAAAGEPSAGQDPDVRYAACIVTEKAEPVLVDLGAAKKLEDSIVRFRQPFSAETVTNAMLTDSERAASQLRREFWRPLQEHLSGIETVLISADGAVGILPFAALPGSEPDSYLLEEYRFAMLPHAAALLDSIDRNHRKEYASMLLVGEVDYGATSGLQLASREADRSMSAKPLPGTAQELEAIRRMRDAKRSTTKLTTLTADQATESNVLKLAPNHQLLHIATHGFFQSQSDDFRTAPPGNLTRPASLPSQNPLDSLLCNFMPGYLSGLALAGCNTSSQRSGGSIDGVLHSAEVESASLQDVDTVVLSACQTALGQEIGGEGLIGLQRAFHIAGVETVIASLWKVDDQATASLMEKFYTNLLQHRMSKLDALRDAQLQMLTEHQANTKQNSRGLAAKPSKVQATKPPVTPASRLKVPTPAYWAAFQLSGKW